MCLERDLELNTDTVAKGLTAGGEFVWKTLLFDCRGVRIAEGVLDLNCREMNQQIDR